MEHSNKYFAFISYNQHDTVWGKRLQRKLEHYRMPATLCSQRGWKRTPINPVFFAPSDIQPGGLNEELQDRLRAAQNLIVICSPNSARSEWVGKEIEFFHQMGRTKNIHFFIVDGVPHSGNPDTECFNSVVNQLGLPEILGANIHERIYRLPWMNRERAYVQLISKLLGVEFDSIWQRHRRLLIRNVIAWVVGVILVLAALLAIRAANQPFNADLRLAETSAQNTLLPPLKDAVVTLSLDNETKTDTLASIDAHALFTNIPHRFLGQQVHASVSCRDFLPLDTLVTLQRSLTLNIQRDPHPYGEIDIRLYNPLSERFCTNVQVDIEGTPVVSDQEGRLSLTVPLPLQRPAYHITASHPSIDDSILMPLGPDAVILVE